MCIQRQVCRPQANISAVQNRHGAKTVHREQSKNKHTNKQKSRNKRKSKQCTNIILGKKYRKKSSGWHQTFSIAKTVCFLMRDGCGWGMAHWEEVLGSLMAAGRNDP